LEVLVGVGRAVVKHWSAHVAIVGSVVPVHGAVEAMRGRFNPPLSAGVRSG
jgi:ribosomal protein L35AE/L33A